MFAYRLCDFAMESNVPLRELPEARGAPADVRFRLEQGADRVRQEPQSWYDARNGDGRVWMMAGSAAGETVLRFPDYAEFRISGDGREIRAHRRGHAPLSTIRHLLLDRVLPLTLSRGAGLVLHAAAVETPRGAIALIAPSGLGKSTLAASLSRSGFPLIADDFLVIREQAGAFVAVPSYPGIRLWSDTATHLFGACELPAVAHYTRKRRCGKTAVAFADRPVRLARMYLLERAGKDEPVATRSLGASAAFLAVARHSFHLEGSESGELARLFEMQAAVARTLSPRALLYPRAFDRLDAVRQALCADLEDLAGAEQVGPGDAS